MGNSNHEMKYTYRFVARFLSAAIANSMLIVICRLIYANIDLQIIRGISADLNRFDMFYTQISISFIIISLVSFLSTTTRVVYWVDVSQYKLIEPRYTSFIDFTAYILASLAVSTLCVIGKSNYIIIPFLISICLLAALTVKMIGSYFGREGVKKELHDRFLQLNKSSRLEYDELKRILIENIYKEIDSKEYNKVEENIDLLMECQEDESFISIMGYMGDAFPELFCNLLNRYDGSFRSKERKITDKYYQLIFSNLIKFIGSNRMSDYVVALYKLYLNARVNQINAAIAVYDNNVDAKALNDPKDPNGRKTREKRNRIIIQYLDIDRYGMGKVYSECITSNSYELLNDLLHIYIDVLKTVTDRIQKYYSDRAFAERLKQIFIVDLEIDKINEDLAQKVTNKEIDGRQINALLRTMIDIYCLIEKMEKEEVEGHNVNMFDKLSKNTLKEGYEDLIKVIADGGMLTMYTVQSKIKCSSDYIVGLLKAYEDKIIDTI